MFKCERKVVRKFALETKKLMHGLCPTNIANKGVQLIAHQIVHSRSYCRVLN
jgi:hypothetical protein